MLFRSENIKLPLQFCPLPRVLVSDISIYAGSGNGISGKLAKAGGTAEPSTPFKIGRSELHADSITTKVKAKILFFNIIATLLSFLVMVY